MNLYDEAIRIWIARKLSKNNKMIYSYQISEVEFGEDGGICTEVTFDYDYAVIKFKIDGQRSWINIKGMSPAKMIEECMEIFKTIQVLPH